MQQADDTQTGIVMVGPVGKEEEFIIHKHLVCATSRFFKAACSKLWTEGRGKIVRSSEVKLETFQAYVVWVYSGKVTVNNNPENGNGGAFDNLIDLYLLGDVLDDIKLRNNTMRSLVAEIKAKMLHPRISVIKQIWDSTPSRSLLRKMIVDATVMCYNRDTFEKDIADYEKEVLEAVAVALIQKVPIVGCDKFVDGLEGYLEPEVSDEPDKSK